MIQITQRIKVLLFLFLFFQSCSSISVINYTNTKCIGFIKETCNQLYLRDLEIIVDYGGSLKEGDNNLDAAMSKLSDRRYLIRIRRDYKKYQNRIAHEIIHIWQMEQNKLFVIDDSLGQTYWKGDTIDMNKISYYERPWEIEAHELIDYLQ